MLRTVAIVTASLLFAFSTPASAQEVDAEAVIKGVEATYKDVQSLRADFVQVTRSKAMGQETRQRGRVQLLRPRKMRWSFTNPPGKLFVTNGETMWVWSATDNQVIISKGMGKGGGGMTQLLDDLGKISDLFDVAMVKAITGPEKRSYVLSLTPKAESQASFQKLELTLSRKKFTVEKVVMVDAFDNEVELSFSQVRTNVELGDDVFSFAVPDGAQVIRTDGP